jgi:hypothetical protein
MPFLTLKVMASLLQLHGPGASIQSDHQGIDALLGDIRRQGLNQPRSTSDEAVLSGEVLSPAAFAGEDMLVPPAGSAGEVSSEATRLLRSSFLSIAVSACRLIVQSPLHSNNNRSRSFS